jgi:hypothetical protein
MSLGLLLALGCAEQQEYPGKLTVWGHTGPDTDLVARIGYDVDNVEAGCVLKYFNGEAEWGPEPDAMGAYMLIFIEEAAASVETNPPPIPGIFESLHAKLYTGLEVVFPTDSDADRNALANYIIGTELKLNPSSPYSFVAEYATGEGGLTAVGDNQVWSIGGRIKF